VPHSPEPASSVSPTIEVLLRIGASLAFHCGTIFLAGPVETDMSPTNYDLCLSFADDTLSALIE
jgi:hypothetical protein